MATFQMPRVARGTKLQPAAPLRKTKEHMNVNKCIVGNKENTEQSRTNGLILENSNKEEKAETVKVRNARRTLHIARPKPLKKTQEETSNETSNLNLMTNQNDKEIQGYSPKTAEIAAGRLIKDALDELDNSAPNIRTNDRTRLLSQVSRDSGFSEGYSRQGSMLESLEESYHLGDTDCVFIDEAEGDILYQKQFNRLLSASEQHITDSNKSAHSSKIRPGDINNNSSLSELFNDINGNNSCVKDRENSSCDVEVLDNEPWLQRTHEDKMVPYPSQKNGLMPRNNPFANSGSHGDDQQGVHEADDGFSEPKNISQSVSNVDQSWTTKDLALALQEKSYKKVKESLVMPRLVNNQETFYPEDIDVIEAELETMRDAEHMEAGSLDFAEENDAAAKSSRIQYSPEELLQIGGSRVCRQRPDCWPNLQEFFPDIYLSTVKTYFDTQSYIDERSYVEEHIGYIIGKSYSTPGLDHREWVMKQDYATGSTQPSATMSDGFKIPQRRGGFGKPPVNSNHSLLQQQPSLTNQSSSSILNFNSSSVDLDTKCDVRVRSNSGGIKLFKAAKSGITSSLLTNRCFARSISEPMGDRSGYTEAKWRPRDTDKMDNEVVRQRCNVDEENVINQDLPNMCPW